jgi:endonuclease/exonuclease/phosphatase family metal-dependent hydrolase
LNSTEFILLPTQEKDLKRKPHPEYTRMGAASIVLSGGLQLRIYATHLTANPTNDEEAHQAFLHKQVNRVFLRMRQDEVAHPNQFQSILMLDFNTRSDTPVYQHMIDPRQGSPYLEDVWTRVHPGQPNSGYTFPTQVPNGPLGRYDYIFVKNNPPQQFFNSSFAEAVPICMKSVRGRCLEWRSDHLPVIATLSFQQGGIN